MATPQRRRLILPASGPRELHRSTFAAPDGTALSAYVPEVGGGWTAHAGTWVITGNALPAPSGASSRASYGGLLPNTPVRETVTFSALTTGVGVTFRQTDAANYWIAYLNPVSNLAVIYEVVAGGFTIRASAAFGPFATATPYAVVVTPSGAAVAVTINGIPAVSYGTMSTGLAATRAGVYADAPVAKFDDELSG